MTKNTHMSGLLTQHILKSFTDQIPYLDLPDELVRASPDSHLCSDASTRSTAQSGKLQRSLIVVQFADYFVLNSYNLTTSFRNRPQQYSEAAGQLLGKGISDSALRASLTRF